MSKPAPIEPPILLGLTLGGYFLGLVLLAPLGFILAPIPVAMCVLRTQWEHIPFFIVVAGLAGVMGLVIGQVTLVVPMMLFALMGIPIAKAIQRQTPYIPLLMATTVAVLLVHLIGMSLQWNALVEQRHGLLDTYHAQLLKSTSEKLDTQLNMNIWVLEHWNDVFIGLAFSSALLGACLSIGWIYRRAVRQHVSEPIGSFSEFRPRDTVVWLVIATAAIGFINYRWPDPWLQTISYNTALGLFTLYSLSGLAIVLHALRLWKPNPILMFVCLLALFWTGGLVSMVFLGLFDTWGDFRERMDERARAAEDSQDHFE